MKKETNPKNGVAEACTPLVSIIMPVYNGERFIKTAMRLVDEICVNHKSKT